MQDLNKLGNRNGRCCNNSGLWFCYNSLYKSQVQLKYLQDMIQRRCHYQYNKFIQLQLWELVFKGKQICTIHLLDLGLTYMTYICWKENYRMSSRILDKESISYYS